MKLISFKDSLIILSIITTFAFFFLIKLSIERAQKKTIEIERIESHSYTKTNCVQYALVATKNAWFPCFRCGGRDSIFLYEDEVWRYGKTCNGEFGRYKSGLPAANLIYIVEYEGTEEECLIEEKEKIYNYPNLPECRKRNFVLLRPPGNKIDR